MNYSECIENARTRIGNYCKACPECNGRAARIRCLDLGQRESEIQLSVIMINGKKSVFRWTQLQKTNRWIHPWSSSERSFYIHFLQDQLVQWDYITATAG